MKFAHELEEALRREGFPPHWIKSAIPYGQLKKCIKRVEGELRSFGLDAETLSQLGHSYSDHEIKGSNPHGGDTPVAFEYQFTNPDTFRPKLILYIQIENGVAMGARLSADTRKYFESMSTNSSPSASSLGRGMAKDGKHHYQNALLQLHEVEGAIASPFEHDPSIRQVEIPLTFDSEFFRIIHGDVSVLDNLQAQEQEVMTQNIRALGSEISKVVNPSKYGKSDLSHWRALFDLYLQAGVFFSTNELDYGSRNATVATKQLQWFQTEVTKREITKSFKLASSREALKRFTSINLALLRNIKFQEINQLAILKILKKFDKRTALGVKKSFPRLIQSDRIMSETMAKAVCAELSREIIQVVPQLDDYLCPVCFSIAYKPVRLRCGHVFCIRCMVKMQRAHDKFCPLCRSNVLLDADSTNLDPSLMSFLQKYFPKEAKAKQKENEFAAGVDMYGDRYSATSCLVM